MTRSGRALFEGPTDVSENPDSTASGWPQRLPLLLVLAVAVTGAVLLRDHLSFEALRAHRDTLLAWRDSHFALVALAFVAAYVAIVAFSLPGATAATLTGGFLFGLFPGALFNVVGASIGAVLIFLAVRAGLGRGLAARIDASEGQLARIAASIRENAFSVLLSIRLVPVVPFFVMNVLPALIGVRLGVFAATTFLGIIPGAVVFTWVGAGLGEVFARGETPDLGIIFEWHVLGPLLGLAALALLPLLLRRLRLSGEARP